VQNEAVRLLHALTAQKLPVDVFARLADAIPRHVPRVASAYTAASSSSAGSAQVDDDDDVDPAERLMFTRTYAETVFSLLAENVSLATSRSYLQTGPEVGRQRT
jgi:hypothetical protein